MGEQLTDGWRILPEIVASLSQDDFTGPKRFADDLQRLFRPAMPLVAAVQECNEWTGVNEIAWGQSLHGWRGRGRLP